MNIGFSTGSISKGDFRRAIDLLNNSSANCIELSSLREYELDDLINALDSLNLDRYKYISFHAPSKLVSLSEEDLIRQLQKVADRGWPIIVHPDIILDFKLWRKLGASLCIENMDKRKPIGRTAKDLQELFEYLPEAGFCFDIAHARQVDPTMAEAKMILGSLSHRLLQLHVSDVNSESKHEPLNLTAIMSYQRVAYMIPDCPIILESPITQDTIQQEIDITAIIFDNQKLKERLSPADSGYISYLKLVESTKTPIF